MVVASGKGDTVYRVLARKYRPQRFDDLIGQEPMVRTLTNAFRTGRIAQAWMLTGVRGVGKTTTARILARALNYRSDTIDVPHLELAEPGMHCEAIMEGRHVDVMEMDAASHTGIDAIREIIDQVRYSPVSARYKVYIIDEVHMLTTQAFNGLLKTLEEPPPHVKFIFATTEIRKVPITVLSRCQRFDLRRVDAALLARHLRGIAEREAVAVEDEALATIARAAEGSVRDALSILDQAIAHDGASVTAASVREMLGLADRTRIIDLFEKLMAGDLAAALAEFASQYEAGGDPAVVLAELAAFTHQVTRMRYVPAAADDVALTEEERRRGADFSARLSVRVLSRAWQMLLAGIEEVQRAARPYSAAEMVLIRIGHAAELPTLDEALATLARPGASAGQRQGGSDSRPSGGGGVSAMARAHAGGGGGAAAMRLVPEDDRPMASAVPVAAPARLQVPVASLEDIVALAEARRDLAFKVSLKNHVRLVSIEPGRLEISLTEDAPKSLPVDLSRRLGEWTGSNWFVSVSARQGGATLGEQEARRRDAALVDARADATVAGVLEAFPGARVIDVRLPEVAEPFEDAIDLPDEPV